MKLDRNINPDGSGKYALLKMRNFPGPDDNRRLAVELALDELAKAGMLDYGQRGTESEFMVIRLKDKYSRKALAEYAQAAADDGEVEYATEIMDMALRAGAFSPWCKKPD